MADTVEEYFEFLKEILNENCISLDNVKQKVSANFDVALRQYDISVIEGHFAEINLNLWEDECNILIKDIKYDVSTLNSLVMEFNALKNFNTVPKLLKTDRYLLIFEDQSLFNETALINVLNNLKTLMKDKVKEIQSSENDESKFRNTFGDLLRSTEWDLDLIFFLKHLRKFTDSEQLIINVLELITHHKFQVMLYDELQGLATTLLKKSSFVNEDLIYSEIVPYVTPVTATFGANSGVFEVHGKIIFLQDVLCPFFESLHELKEIHIFCEIFHIHEIASKSIFNFDVENLVINSDVIKVHTKVTIDLSATHGKSHKSQKAGQGVNGEDGYAGGNGGNCFIVCSSIVNPHLTIYSNGGNGSDGQDGGDGKDGVNGRDVEKSDFAYDGRMFEMRVFNLMPFIGKRAYDKDGVKVHYVVQNVLFTNCFKFMLCKGVDGTPGMPGGFFGLGGEAGTAGHVKIACKDANKVAIKTFNGKQGKNGTAGYNGVSGKDGRDAWAYDHCYQAETMFVGLNEFCKYELEFSSVDKGYSAWCCDDRKYVSAKKIGEVKSVSSFRVRNETMTTRLRSSHATAKKGENCTSKNLANSYSKSSFGNHSLKFNDICVDTNIINIPVKVRIKATYKNACSVNNYSIKLDTFHTLKVTFEEVKNKILNENFLNIIEKSDLTTENYNELKKSVWNTKGRVKRNVQFVLDQKIALSYLRKNFEIIVQNINESFKIQAVPKAFEKEISYLKNTNAFDMKIKSLIDVDLNLLPFHDFFNVDSLDIRKQIQKFFSNAKKKCFDEAFSQKPWFFHKMLGSKKVEASFEDLLLGIIMIMFKSKNDIRELDDFIKTLEFEYTELIKLLFDNKILSTKCLEKVQLFLRKFYGNKLITKFIENDLTSRGIFSPIYKKIMAFAFNVKIKIFCKNLDGSLCCIGSFEAYEKFDSLNPKDECTSVDNLNLLMTKKCFTILNFNEQKFSRDHLRECICIATHETKEINLLTNHAPKDWQKLAEIILKSFPLLTDKETSQIETMMANIELSNGISILKSISIRLKYEDNQLSFKEFKLILLIILEMICENSVMVEYFKANFLALKHTEWTVEIILLKIEDYLNINDIEVVNQWRQILRSLSCRKILVLFLNEIEKLEEGSISKNDFIEIIKNMKFFCSGNYKDLVQLNDLVSWKYVITTQYWLNNFQFLTHKEGQVLNELLSKFSSTHIETLLTTMQNKSTNIKNIDINKFLKNFNTGEWIFSDHLFKILLDDDVENWNESISSMYNVEGGQRSVEQITMLIEENTDTSDTIKVNADNISKEALQVLRRRSEVENLDEVKIKKLLSDKTKLESTINMLHIISQVFKLITGNELRHTQIISLLTLWEGKNSSLIQVSTGEGKTFIGVGLSILKFLSKEKVHIVTSSNVLAERDATNETSCKIFEFFGIKVGHNCSESTEERRRAYKKCDVIYGSLGNFQRDYLLTKFFEENLFKTENLQNVIVDEVDSILLDRGNNILYLSQELPCVDELQSLFIFIWQYVNQPADDIKLKQEMLKPENMRIAVIENWLGRIDEDCVRRIIVGDEEVKCDDIIKILRESGYVDDECSFCPKTSHNITEIRLKELFGSLKLSNDSLCGIIYYILKILSSSKAISFPSFLNTFALNHLDKWIASAITAICMEDGREYVIDRVHTSNSNDLDPNIVIMDVETGTDLKSSEWDEALCQFLQLKHGCKLSLYSLKSIFISNVSYFKLYTKLYGMSGTLGSNYERLKLTEFYKLDYVTIPTFLPKKFTEFEAILTKTTENWIFEVLKEAKAMFEKKRSVLVICNTIKDIQMFKAAFDNSDFCKNIKIYTYQRDYESFKLPYLSSNVLIIATNLAGRGTDIKLSEELKSLGGLHVILTYVASNVRIESQAFGRASRAGAKGSARLIVSHLGNETIQELKIERDNAELTRLDSVATYYNNFISAEEGLFSLFMMAYKSFSSRISDKDLRKILLENLKISWTFWLDENSERIKDFQMERVETHKFFETFISNVTNISYEMNDLHPMTRLELARYFDKKNDFTKAKNILQIELKDGVLVQKDWVALNYMSNYVILKENSYDDNYNKRSLRAQESSGLKSTLQMFYRKENEERARETFIKAHKERKTLFPINGYDNQNKNISNIQKLLTESLMNFLGTGITPESFNCMPFRNRLVNEEFYNYLIGKGFITNPKIAIDFDISDVDLASIAYGFDATKLNEFLANRKGNFIDSLDKFANEIEKNLNFPSREHFWRILVKKEFLINNVDYAIIDYQIIKEFNPKVADRIYKACKDFLIKEFTVENNADIFLYNVDNDNELIKHSDGMPKKLAVDLTKMRNSDHFKTFIPSDSIKINSKAEFNVKRFLECNFNFEHFDSITKDDFHFIKSDLVRENLLLNLVEQGILLKSFKDASTFHLNCKKLFDLDLGKDFIYEDELFKVLESKFVYRFALESLAHKVQENIANNENSQNESIELYLSPQSMMLHDLIANFIIQPSMVNQDKTNELEMDNFFKNCMTYGEMLDYFKNYLPENIHCNELLDEVLTKNKLLLNDLKCYVQVNLSLKFQSIESDVQELLDRKRYFIENKQSIITTIKNGVEHLNSNFYVNPSPVLIPLKTLIPDIDDDLLNHMKLMGFDYIIKIEDNSYSSSFFINITAVILMGLVQIAMGAFLVIKPQAISGYKFITEGFYDIAYALSSLFTGTFSWKDFSTQKVMRALVTLSKFVFSKAKKLQLLQRLFGSEKNGKLSETKNAIQQQTQKISFSQLISKGKEAGLPKLIDRLLEKALYDLKRKIQTKCTDAIKENFFKHDVLTTIDHLLMNNSEDDVMDLVTTNLTTILNDNASINSILSHSLNYVRTAMSSGTAVNENLILGLSIANEAITTEVMAIRLKSILNNLNEKLEQQIKDTSQIKGNMAFKDKVLRVIHSNVLLSLKVSINQNIESPLINYAANKSITRASAGTMWVFKNITGKRDTHNAAKLVKKQETFPDENATAGDIDYDKNIKKCLIKLKRKSKDPKVIANLSKLDLPLVCIEMEAAAQLFKVTFVVSINNIEHRFGVEGREVEIDLNDEHFESSSDQQEALSIDCFYRCLKDIIDTPLTSEEFREKIVEVILNNYAIETKIIKNTYHDIGFYDGGDIDKKSTKSRSHKNENQSEKKMLLTTPDKSGEFEGNTAKIILNNSEIELELAMAANEKQTNCEHVENNDLCGSGTSNFESEKQSDEEFSSPTPATSTLTHHISTDETCVEVAVVFQDYPRDLLDFKQANVIEENIHELILDSETDWIISCNYFEGTLRFKCGNQQIADWLKNVINDIKVSEKRLTAYQGDSMPKFQSFSVFIPGKQISFKRFQTIITKQKTGLNPQQWFMTNKIDTESGRNIFLKVDCESATMLEAMNFLIKWGLKVVTFEKVNDDKKAISEEDSTDSKWDKKTSKKLKKKKERN